MSGRRWSLARRLRSWFTLVCVIPLAVSAVVGGWFLGGSVTRELEALVREELDEAVAMLRNEADPPRAFADISAELASQHPEVVMGWRISDRAGVAELGVFGDRALLAELRKAPGLSEAPRSLREGVLFAARDLPDGSLLQVVIDGAVYSASLRRYWIAVLLVVVLSLALALGLAQLLATKVARLLAGVAADLRRPDGEGLDNAPDEIRKCAEELRDTLRRIRAHGEQTRMFMASLAHELRSPIQNLLGRAEVTLLRSRDVDTYREALQEQIEELAEFGDAVDNFLALCASDSLDGARAREEFDLEHEMRLRMQREQQRAERLGLRLDISCSGATRMLGDRESVLRAVRNVIANAVDWSESGAEVRVRLEAVGNDLVLTVDDAGPGIPEAVRDDVFQPFRQNQHPGGRRSGFGLGLAIAKKAVEAQGGTIHVSTSPLGGARFRLVLPRDPSGPALLDTGAADPAPGRRSAG